jgi:hypothetical protein
MPDTESHDDEPTVAPTTLEPLLAENDAACRLIGLELDRLKQPIEQLHPERARSCRTAVTLARVGVDEVRDRAHSRPLGET